MMRNNLEQPDKGALKDFWGRLDCHEKEQLAEDVESSVGYLRQVFLYGRRVSPLLAKELEKHTALSKRQFRPDVFDEAD